MRRRSFLKGAGVVTVLVAGGAVWRAEDQGVFSVGEGPAFRPWKDWREDASTGPLVLIRAAILAASPHNTQPWLFKATNSWIELYADTSRNLGAADPYLREQHIALGCALENLMLAADANGYSASATLVPGKLELSPASQRTLVAHIALAPGSPHENELYDAIPHRHTNRNPYEPTSALPPGFAEALAGLPGDDPNVKIFLFASDADRKKIAHMISTANDSFYSDPAVQAGSNGPWIRLSRSAVEKYRDGIDLDCLGFPPAETAILKMLPKAVLKWLGSHSNYNENYLNYLLRIPMFGFIAVRDRYDQEQSLCAGRIWQRAHLLATSRGLAARPANEAVEMVDHERRLGQPPQYAGLLAQLMGDEAWQPTFTFCMGHAIRPAPASPRRPYRDVVL